MTKKKTDWDAIKADYIYGRMAAHEIADRYNINPAAVRQRIKRGGWSQEKEVSEGYIRKATAEAAAEAAIKAQNNIARAEAERIQRLRDIACTMEAPIIRAIQELGQHMVINKKRVRVITYGGADAKGKPIKEVIDDEEILNIIDAPIDRQGLKQLTSALRDLCEVQRDRLGVDQSNEDVHVTFEGADMEAASE
jgi:uncharacterized protein YjcR